MKTPQPKPRSPARRSLLQRVAGRITRMVVGDRVLLPRRMADTLWHLSGVRHRIRGGRIVVRFDNLDADITLDARSDLALRALGEGTYEQELLGSIPWLAGHDDVVNVGANVGIVAIALARALATGKRVLCIDPIPECVELLKQNLATAGVSDRTIVLQAFAAATADGDREMWTVPGKPEYSSGGPIVHAAVAAEKKVSQTVPTIRIDDAVAAAGLAPGAIVMDCEGGEFNALRGATKTIAAHGPTIVLEFDPPLLAANGGGAAEFLRFFAGCGYGCIALTPEAGDVGADFAGTAVAVPTGRLADCRRTIVEALARA